MRAARRTAEEQYRLVLECRKSGLSDSDWCRGNGINPATFYTWITRLRKRESLPVPPASSQSTDVRSQDIVRLDVLPEETVCRQADDKNVFFPGRKDQTSDSLIEIEAQGVTFRFSGAVDAALYEKTLFMIGGRL